MGKRGKYSFTRPERKAYRLLDELGLEYSRQHPIHIKGYTLRLDALIIYDNQEYALEIDGVRYHGSRRELDKSVWRDNLLLERGVIPIHFWDYELDDPEWFKAELIDHLDNRQPRHLTEVI